VTVNRTDGRGLRSSEAVAEALHLVLNNTLDAIEDGRGALTTYFEALGLDARTVNRLEVIFEEVVANTVRHGFTAGSDQSIHVRAQPLPGEVELAFEDDGEPFNPLLLAEPDRYSDLATAKIGGRGVQLVRKLSSSLHYERVTPGEASGQGFEPCNRLRVTVASQ
jgi:anti-sigma regulatory factor (Ser/Thr protein kinase)